MYRVLILGGSGLVGKAIENEMTQRKPFQVYSTFFLNSSIKTAGTHFQMGIGDLETLKTVLKEVRPHILISCLRGDFESQLIFHSEAADFLKQNGGTFYFFSTTNVFDGDLTKPHYEEDRPDSSTAYGLYKLNCEKVIKDILGDRSVILRIPQVWGKNSPRMDELSASLKNDSGIVVYPRLFINANTDAMIAKQILHIIENGLSGIFHLASEDVMAHEDFYSELIKKLGFSSPKMMEEEHEAGYFALLSRRINEFPDHLRFSNQMLIEELAR